MSKKSIFVLVVLALSISTSSLTFASDISSLIKDLGDKKYAKDASFKLAKIGKPAVPELIKALESNNKYQKRYAARSIREMGQAGSDAIPALEKLLKDWDTQTREYAVEALGNMTQQANQVMPILKKARKDSDKDVRKKAKMALEKLNRNIFQKAQKAKQKIEKEKREKEKKLKEQKQEELRVEEEEKLKSDSIKVVTVIDNKVYLNYGGAVGIELGQSYAVYVQGKTLVDPDTGIKLGVEEENIGVVKVVDVKKEFSVAKIMEGTLTEQHKGAICRALVSKVDKTKIISIKRGKVYLNYGESEGAKVGQLFEVYAKGNALEDPDTGVKLGIEEEKVGVVEVIDVQVEYSIAKVLEGTLSEMHEGDICSILVFDTNDKMQEPSGEAGKALETSQLKIITAKEKKAYLNQGKSKGIKAGQTYAVYVQGEALKDPDTGIKLGIEEEKVGIIKVIDVRDEYSIATIVEGLIKEQHRGAICRIVKFEAKGNVGNIKLPESLGQSENVAKKIEIKKSKNNLRNKKSSPESNPLVLGVIRSRLSGYEQTTTGQAFNTFFANPTWELKTAPNGAKYVHFTGVLKEDVLIEVDSFNYLPMEEGDLFSFKFAIFYEEGKPASFKLWSMKINDNVEARYGIDWDATKLIDCFLEKIYKID